MLETGLMRILVVEDDAEAATAMVRGLTEAGHEPTHAVDGAFGLLEAQKGGYDVYVVDRMMPRLDGIGMVETLRKDGDQTPVLFLSALGEVEDRVTGLKAGADDYLVKPYAFSELIARTVHRGGQEIDLQPREFQLLEFLMRHAGQSVTRTMLLEKVWEYHFDPQTNVIDVHISRLRAKIDKGFDHAMLQTVRGAGYRLEA